MKNLQKKYLTNNKNKTKIKVFIQVNIGDEEQKSGINKSSLTQLYSYCKTIDLSVVGLMCIPPFNHQTFLKDEYVE